MAGTDITMTGAAGVSPTPAVVVRRYGPCDVVGTVPAVAALASTGLSIAAAGSRPRGVDAAWITGFGGSVQLHLGNVAGTGGFAQRTTSSTPGDLTPRDPLS